MPAILFAGKAFSLLITDFFNQIPIFLILGFFFVGVVFLIKIKKEAKWVAGILFFLIFLLFDLGKTENQFNKLTEINAEVKETYYRKEKTMLILQNEKYKVWSYYPGRLEIKNGYQIKIKGLFFPVREKNYFYSEEFTHTGKIDQLEIINAAEKINFATYFFHRYFEKADFPFLYYGFILGERTQMPDKIIDLFRENGCLHILAISGSHIAIIIAFLFFLLKLMPLPPKISLFLILAVIWGYLLLLDFSPAPLRAIVFTTILIFAKLLERRMSLLDILFISGFLILLFDPKMIYSLGFLLSFFATLGILLALPIIRKITAIIKPRPIEYIVDGILIGFFAQLLIFPILLYYFKTLNLISLFLSIPLTLLSTPILFWSLTGLLLFPFWEKLGQLFIPPADFMTYLMLKIMTWTYEIKALEIKTGMNGFFAVGIYLPIFIILIGIKKKYQLKNQMLF